jgi:hypothetical protein
MSSQNHIVLIPANILQTTLVHLTTLVQQIIDNLVEDNIVLIPAIRLQTTLTQLTLLLQQILENLVEENADTDEEQPSNN